MKKRKIAILGATGSVGENTAAVLRNMRESFDVVSLTAHTNLPALAALAQEFQPEYIGVTGCQTEKDVFPEKAELGFGQDALCQACQGADLVVLAVVGMAGLRPFVYCLKNGIPVALANKEAMVYGGRLVRQLMDETKTPVIPIDSELSAILQCLAGNRKEQIQKILLTASGGPFRTWEKERIQKATVAQALKHPNWQMGIKTTIDCATMLNKGLEVMEVRWMFDIAPEKIQVVVHPESIVHSMVEYVDGSLMAQLSVSDMKLPIAHALCYPERSNKPMAARLNLMQMGALHFEAPDPDRFGCLKLAYAAIQDDGNLQRILNSANEVAVQKFLDGCIPFLGIEGMIEQAMAHFAGSTVQNFEDIYALDEEVRAFCREI